MNGGNAALDNAGLFIPTVVIRCDFLIHNIGNLTNPVLLTQTDFGSELIGGEYVHSSRERVPAH